MGVASPLAIFFCRKKIDVEWRCTFSFSCFYLRIPPHIPVVISDMFAPVMVCLRCHTLLDPDCTRGIPCESFVSCRSSVFFSSRQQCSPGWHFSHIPSQECASGRMFGGGCAVPESKYRFLAVSVSRHSVFGAHSWNSRSWG